jgi:hypothetical protein
MGKKKYGDDAHRDKQVLKMTSIMKLAFGTEIKSIVSMIIIYFHPHFGVTSKSSQRNLSHVVEFEGFLFSVLHLKMS